MLLWLGKKWFVSQSNFNWSKLCWVKVYCLKDWLFFTAWSPPRLCTLALSFILSNLGVTFNQDLIFNAHIKTDCSALRMLVYLWFPESERVEWEGHLTGSPSAISTEQMLRDCSSSFSTYTSLSVSRLWAPTVKQLWVTAVVNQLCPLFLNWPRFMR